MDPLLVTVARLQGSPGCRPRVLEAIPHHGVMAPVLVSLVPAVPGTIT